MLCLSLLSVTVILLAEVTTDTVPLDFSSPEDQEMFQKYGILEGIKKIKKESYATKVAEAYGQGEHLLACDEIDIPKKDHLKKVSNTAQAFRDRAQYLKFIQPVSQEMPLEYANKEISRCHKSYREQYTRQLCIHERRRGVRCPGDETELLPKHQKIPKTRQCRRIITKIREVEKDYKTAFEKYTELQSKIFKSGSENIDLPVWKEFCFQELEVLGINTEYEAYLSIFKELECREEISRSKNVPKVMVDKLEQLEEMNKGKTESWLRRKKIEDMERERLKSLEKEEQERIRFLEGDEDKSEEDDIFDKSGKFKMDL